MPTPRSITTPLVKRPTIREISARILTPSPVCHARQIQHLPRPAASSASIPQIPQYLHSRARSFHLSSVLATLPHSHPPKSHDRGPASSETTQTDFSNLDVLGATPVPSTSIDACLWDGFHLNNGVKIHGAGVLLVDGEAFEWRPWEAGKNAKEKRLLNAKGQWEVDDSAWGVLEVVWPKPGMRFPMA